MSSYENLIKKINEVSKNKRTLFIAISGFGGSGKSHLTNQLCKQFNIEPRQVIRIDHLYGPNPDGPHVFDQADWPLLESILKNAKLGMRIKYRGKSFEGDPIYVDEALPNIVIIEGIRLLQPALMQYFDISVWIACPQDIAIQRAKARDRSQGEDEETVNRWDSDWGPKDKMYFDQFHPDKLADFIYEDYQ